MSIAGMASSSPGREAASWGAKIVMSERWKELERTAARVLGGERFPRWLGFGQSAPVFLVPDFRLVVDAKADTIARKYCEKGEVPVLVTKHANQTGCYATISLEFLGDLQNAVRCARREGG